MLVASLLHLIDLPSLLRFRGAIAYAVITFDSLNSTFTRVLRSIIISPHSLLRSTRVRLQENINQYEKEVFSWCITDFSKLLQTSNLERDRLLTSALYFTMGRYPAADLFYQQYLVAAN